MKRPLILAIVLAFSVIAVWAQVPPELPTESAKDVVERLWCMATSGYLLTSTGWNSVSKLFVQPDVRPASKDIVVMSNYWGVSEKRESATSSKADILTEYEEVGRLDSALRFTTKLHSSDGKTWMAYHVALTTIHIPVLKADGKTVEREIAGPVQWRIQGHPDFAWTTVNTAICYVIEMRAKTNDPVIKKNANDSIAILMRLRKDPQ
jgi:hypothetical protein